MLKTMLLSMVAATAWLLGQPAELNAYGARHVGYTHVGPGGVYHYGRTAGYGPGGAFSTGHAGAYGYGGGYARTGYGAGVGYGGYGGYRYGTGYGAYGGYRYGYRGW
jgi:hypothetical protein